MTVPRTRAQVDKQKIASEETTADSPCRSDITKESLFCALAHCGNVATKNWLYQHTCGKFCSAWNVCLSSAAGLYGSFERCLVILSVGLVRPSTQTEPLLSLEVSRYFRRIALFSPVSPNCVDKLPKPEFSSAPLHLLRVVTVSKDPTPSLDVIFSSLYCTAETFGARRLTYLNQYGRGSLFPYLVCTRSPFGGTGSYFVVA